MGKYLSVLRCLSVFYRTGTQLLSYKPSHFFSFQPDPLNIKAASKSKARTADALFCTLECRLDNLVYRIGFANSIRLARQQVTHRHILVNGKNVNIPSYICKAGDVISLKENSRSNELFKSNFLERESFALPYISKDKESFSGTLVRLPMREEIPIQIEDQLVVEYFSR